MKLTNSKYLLVKICFLLLAGAVLISTSYDEVVIDKNKQIENFQKQIDTLRKKLDINNSLISKYKHDIDSLNSIIAILTDFLKDYETEQYLSAEQIAIETNMIFFLEEEVEKLQEIFKKRIVNLYKHGKNYELELLMSSKTPNEYLRRNEYLQRFAQNRTRELRELKAKKFILSEKKKMLGLSVSSRRFYVEVKRNERETIQNEINQIKILQVQKENENESIDLQIIKYQKDIRAIKTFLSNLQNNKEKFTGIKQPRISISSSNLQEMKGHINSPIDAGLLKNYFGQQINNSTNTLFFNSGIDISISKNSRVFSIADGIVTLTGESPFYGKIIIIMHDNNFRSVYACLTDIIVKTGDKVRLNHLIARTGQNSEGQLLHFELWHNETPLNPEEWLRF